MGKKLFVGNLSWGTDESSLEGLFAEFGPIREIKVITDRETGRSRGFAFVTFETDAAAEAALATDGGKLDGRDIRVSIAEDRRNGGGGGGGGFRPRHDNNDTGPEIIRRDRDSGGGAPGRRPGFSR